MILINHSFLGVIEVPTYTALAGKDQVSSYPSCTHLSTEMRECVLKLTENKNFRVIKSEVTTQ